MVNRLTELGADVNVKDNKGNAPIHLVCWNRNLEVFNRLVELGADIKGKDGNGQTPFQLANK